MNDSPAQHAIGGWWSALRRRKVVHWGLLYLAGAWGFLQGFEYLSDTYDWPRQVQQLATLALIIGLPIVLVLAWYHGDRGHQNVTTPEFAILTLLLLLGGAALWYYQHAERGDAGRATTAAGPSTDAASANETPMRPVVADARPSLAVLPFADLSQSRDQEYLGDGLAEEILNQLAQVPALRLVGRTSSFSFKGTSEDLPAIGEKLGVAHLLEGSVRKSGDRIRITAQLVSASDGSHLWSKTYDRKLTDVFAVQDEIARDVAQALSVKLDAVSLNRAQGGTTNIEAYDRYLRWRQSVLSDIRGAEHDRQRVQLAREAVALDAEFVLAWDALARSLNQLADEVDDAQAGRLRAEATQVRARIAELAPDSWTVKRERAYALWREGRRAEAIAEAEAIMKGGPLTYERAFPYTNLIFAAGHLDETVALVEQLKTVDPLAMFLSRDLQFDYTAARRFDAAETEYQRSLSLAGNHVLPAYLAFLRALAQQEADPGLLRDLHEQVLKELDWTHFADLGRVLNDREAMRRLLREAAADSSNGQGTDNWVIGEIADALGETEIAVAALRELTESRPGFKDGHMSYASYFPLWTSPYSGVRAHPEFKKLMIETGLVDYWRQTGKWADDCEPVGAEDFRCQ